jgi:hypothetical protein
MTTVHFVAKIVTKTIFTSHEAVLSTGFMESE